jgi:hypothetical protein
MIIDGDQLQEGFRISKGGKIKGPKSARPVAETNKQLAMVKTISDIVAELLAAHK